FVGRPLSVDPHEVHFVDTDNVAGGELAARHLIERGATRIATIAGPQDMSAGVDRLTGWRNAVHAAGMSDDAVLHGDFTLASGARLAHELVEKYPDVDGVFVASDLMAAGALAALTELGKDVPGDIKVVGYDN